jgi:hypothetical protein
MRDRSIKTKLLIGLMAMSVLASACAKKTNPLEVGLRRVALDLAFKDPGLAESPTPREVVRTVAGADYDYTLDEVPDDLEEVVAPPKRTILPTPPRRAPEPECEEAPPGQGYDVPTYPVVKDPPREGVYTRRYTGTVKISTALFDIALPYPSKAKVEVSNVSFGEGAPLVGPGDATALPPGTQTGSPTAFPQFVEYRLTRFGPSGFKQVDTMRYTKGGTTGGDYLYLVKRETTASGTTKVFQPTPAIRYIELYAPEGDDSANTFAGVDREHQTALTVQSKILARESVDICGEVFDSFRVQIQENFADLSRTPPEVSGNASDQYNYWNIQFDHGMLLLREEVHSTLQTTTEVAGAPTPITVYYDYVGTLNSVEPTAFPTNSAGGESTTTTTVRTGEEGE